MNIHIYVFLLFKYKLRKPMIQAASPLADLGYGQDWILDRDPIKLYSLHIFFPHPRGLGPEWNGELKGGGGVRVCLSR